MSNRIYREVVKCQFQQSSYCKRGHGRWIYTLECGHVSDTKASQRQAKRRRCDDCEWERRQHG